MDVSTPTRTHNADRVTKREFVREMGERLRGTVSTFCYERGCGYIRPDGGGETLMVRHRCIRGEGVRYLLRGEAVEYQIDFGPDGSSPMAVDVTGPGESKLRWAGERLRGTVCYFNYEKGYGFITPEGGGRNVYVPSSGIRYEGIWTLGLGWGEAVEYQLLPATNRAIDVTGPGQSEPKGTYSGLPYGGKRARCGSVGFGGSPKKMRSNE